MTCSNPNATESANVTEKLKAHARELEPYISSVGATSMRIPN